MFVCVCVCVCVCQLVSISITNDVIYGYIESKNTDSRDTLRKGRVRGKGWAEGRYKEMKEEKRRSESGVKDERKRKREKKYSLCKRR